MMTDSHNPPTIITDDQRKNFVHEQDYEYSRDTYYDLIEKGRESLDLMIQVARESEHPRAFEVLSNMIKDIANVNDKLMELNKKQKELLQDEKPKETNTTNNNLFIGSTTELQRFLLGDKDEKVIDQDDE
jgi:hypothetical protein